MPKYLFQSSFVDEGLKGLIKDGGSKRRETVEQMVKGLGGTVEAFYFAFGDFDVCAIVDLPDNISTLGLSLFVNASGASKVKTVVLLTPEEVDQATKMNVEYRPPGQ